MTSNTIIESWIVHEDDPDWGPLEAMVGPDGHDEFEWRAEVELRDRDGTRVQAYKHTVSGHYLYLSDGGRAYHFVGEEHYLPIDPDDALWLARGPFAHLWGFGPERTRGPGGVARRDIQVE